MTTETTAVADPLEKFVHQQAARLWQGYSADRADAVAILARLRRTFPHRGEVAPESFELFERGFPTDSGWDHDEASPTELAAAASLALYAFHQQSRRSGSAHRRGDQHGVGRAAATLRVRADPQGVERRMQAMIRSTSVVPLLEHLRGFVTLLRAHDIPLDYARLARDLRAAQSPSGLRGVRVRWSRDFYRPRTPETEASGPTDPTPGDPA